MTPQIAIRIPDGQLEELDDAIKRGELKNRADAVRRGLDGLLAELRERRIAREYREAYARHPDQQEIGDAGLELLADVFKRDEAGSS